MEQKIQLLHPSGKRAVRIDINKYVAIKKALLNCLKQKKELTHKEILQSVIDYFKKNKIKFEGSVEWYMESVKLDLEANKIIERVYDKSRLKFKLAK
ncbi:MAG TPA: hypothetical protein VH396_03945 [Chitinophagaceae bacterium]|jgi:hypothetical protein